MNFSDALVDLDTTIEDHLCDDASYQPEFGTSKPVRVMIEHPSEIERIQGSAFSRSRPTLQVAYAAAPELREGDKFWLSDDDYWAVASAPTRTTDGRWWLAEIEPA